MSHTNVPTIEPIDLSTGLTHFCPNTGTDVSSLVVKIDSHAQHTETIGLIPCHHNDIPIITTSDGNVGNTMGNDPNTDISFLCTNSHAQCTETTGIHSSHDRDTPTIRANVTSFDNVCNTRFNDSVVNTHSVNTHPEDNGIPINSGGYSYSPNIGIDQSVNMDRFGNTDLYISNLDKSVNPLTDSPTPYPNNVQATPTNSVRMKKSCRRYKKSRYTARRRSLIKASGIPTTPSQNDTDLRTNADISPVVHEIGLVSPRFSPVSDYNPSHNPSSPHNRRTQLKPSFLPPDDNETQTQNTATPSFLSSTPQLSQPTLPRTPPSSDSIINLSSITLSHTENVLLAKGVGFCPTPRNIDSLQLNQDMLNFSRRMRLKEYFFGKQQQEDYNPFKPKSSWNPPKRNQTLELFLHRVCSDIQNITFNRHNDNLTREERQALRSLRSNTDIIIKPADKGSAVVILDKTSYIQEGARQLGDDSAYKPIRSDPTLKHTTTVQKTIQQLDIDEEIIPTLSPNAKDVKCPLFYMLPKVHKIGTPGRPIVSGLSCPTAQISRFVDYHLRPLVEALPSYIQDTTHFIRHLDLLNNKAPFPQNTLLVSADVSALYTNINHHDGLRSCKTYLNTRHNKEPPTDHLIRLLELILSLNCFEFNNQFYKQILGIRMGTCAAPSVANLFMGSLENKLLSSAVVKPFIGSWKRYIDDIHFLWTEGPDSLLEFQNFMNGFHPTISFTFDVSPTQVPFLDTLTQIKNNRIETTLYSKPTDKHTYLLPSSCHPPHTFKGIPYSQALRVRRICSLPEEEEIHLTNLKDHLIAREYAEDVIDKQINKAKRQDKKSLLTYKPKKKNTRVPLVTTYNPAFNQIHNIVRKHMHLINDDDKLSQVFPSPPIAAFRRPRNIRDLLVNARVKPSPDDTQKGCTKCTSKKCAVCPFIVESHKFTSSSTGESFPITSHAHCKSTWVIYLITCKKCNKQYVGKTTTSLYTRFTNTKSDIKNRKKNLPIVDHFNSKDHSIADVSLMAIENINNKTDHNIEKRESYWIAKLRTLRPDGINADS